MKVKDLWSGIIRAGGIGSLILMLCASLAFAGGDHGSDIYTATSVSANSRTSGVIGTGGDNDYFRITLTSAGTIRLTTENSMSTSGGTLDTYGYLLDANGNQIAYNDDSGGNLQFLINQDLAAGTYYVRVRAYSSTSTGSYTLVSEFTGSSDDHGDDIWTSTAVSANSRTSGTIDPAGDNDYFRIDLSSSGTLRLTSESSFDTYGYLLDANGSQITYNDDSGGNLQFLINQDLAAGTYYVQVRAYSSATTGSYTLVSEFTGGSQVSVSAPVFSPNGGAFYSSAWVSLTSNTYNATIYYTTNGSTPSVSSGIPVSSGSMIEISSTATLQAIAVSGGTSSSVTQASFVINSSSPFPSTVSAPTMIPNGGTFPGAVWVTLNSTTSGATIIYTTDGTMPTISNGRTVSSGTMIQVINSGPLRAVTLASDGTTISSETVSMFTISTSGTSSGTVSTPVFSPAGGTYSEAQQVMVMSATSGATIRYTTDGSTPSQTNGTEIANGGLIPVTASMTLQAIAYAAGSIDSGVVSESYTISSSQSSTRVSKLMPQVLLAGFDPILIDITDTSFDVTAIVRSGLSSIQYVTLSENTGGFSMSMTQRGSLENGDLVYSLTFTFPRGSFPSGTALANLFGSQAGQYRITAIDQAQQRHGFPDLMFGNYQTLSTSASPSTVSEYTSRGSQRLSPQTLMVGFDPILIDLADTSFKVKAVVRPGRAGSSELPIQNVTLRNGSGFAMAMSLESVLPNGDMMYALEYVFPRGSFPEGAFSDVFGDSNSGQFVVQTIDAGQQTHDFPRLMVGNYPAM